MLVVPITYTSNVIKNDVESFNTLWDELDWTKSANNRLEYYTHDYDLPYTYGTNQKYARTYQPQFKHQTIKHIQDVVEGLVDYKFDVCFLNGYRDGKDHLGWHRDFSDDDTPIVIVSLGANREIYFRENPTPEIKSPLVTKLLLESGSMCTMLPYMQTTHQHRIPKSDLFQCDRRISLTFRCMMK